ncbi:flagellar motor protein MotB [Mariniblastus fucicola]|uniref:Flagellar motor protein MotB n=1 Tax=Mariniblastus fucicola TaxID=980251 RepID=A0A5B9P9F8_9BACT|nr:flagellar motor protein MotB [Mariniblastus fucicola]QEG23377.1 flagellar motor protein MotB [Mariniblastus fucicola]
MAREKPPEPPPEDIPVWFMTYSDVITLLMTFFILLLTFSTTEPEKFDKVQPSSFGSSGATGIVGHVHERMDNKSWVERIRPRAARIAINGSEIPPMNTAPQDRASGLGIESASEEEAEKDVMTTNSFKMKFNRLVNNNGNVTPRGIALASLLTQQLRSMPVHCSIRFANQGDSKRATAFLLHLYEVHGVRPGQVGIGWADNLQSDLVAFDMERYEQ